MMNTIFFDLDGTLLNLTQEAFMSVYVSELVKFTAKSGYKPEDIKKALFNGMDLMNKNEGERTNDACFWEGFAAVVGAQVYDEREDYLEFYKNEFNILKRVTSSYAGMKECIDGLKKKGYTLVLTTNPLLPREATYARTRWAGLEVDDFVRITTYENSTFCKPKLGYFIENLAFVNKQGEECLMVGNNVKEDMVAEQLGLDTYLVIDNLENEDNVDTSTYKQGTMLEAIAYLNALPSVKG